MSVNARILKGGSGASHADYVSCSQAYPARIRDGEQEHTYSYQSGGAGFGRDDGSGTARCRLGPVDSHAAAASEGAGWTRPLPRRKRLPGRD
jgi:hypothetical protein